ncbi:MAG: thioredoxin domain-containing protein [Arcobacteraceae bacterium]
MIKKLTLFVSCCAAATTLYAKAVESDIIAFEKKRFESNKQIELKNVELHFKQEMKQKDWYAYILNIEANYQGKAVKFKDIVFSNGIVVAPELLDIKSGNSLKESVVPSLSNKYYNKSNLLLGNSNAKDKIVVFSDPLCPFCMDYIPDVIKHVEKNKEKVALYYYHFPLLQIHPASKTLSELMDVAQEQGVKDIILRTYTADWDKYFAENETDEKKILESFNKEFNLNITLEQIQAKKIQDKILNDISMAEDVLVQGTPTIFVNGQYDKSKTKFLETGK